MERENKTERTIIICHNPRINMIRSMVASLGDYT